MASQTPQSISVSSLVAKLVAKDAPYANRLAAARGETALDGRDLFTALYFLYGGGDREIRTAVVRTLRQQAPEILATVAALPDFPPRILHFLAQVRGNEPLLFQVFLDHPRVPKRPWSSCWNMPNGAFSPWSLSVKRYGVPFRKRSVPCCAIRS